MRPAHGAGARRRAPRIPPRGTRYSSGKGMCEYERARITVMTAPVKYSTRPIPATTPMTGTSSRPPGPPPPRPWRCRARATTSVGRRSRSGTPRPNGADAPAYWRGVTLRSQRGGCSPARRAAAAVWGGKRSWRTQATPLPDAMARAGAHAGRNARVHCFRGSLPVTMTGKFP